MKVLEYLQQPHTFREVQKRFWFDVGYAVYKLKQNGAITVVGFIRGHDQQVFLYQATGKKYLTQKTKKYYARKI